MRPVFLIGFMCSGKTTLGRALAQALHVDFVDLDHYIEHKHGLTVRQIFARHGEAAFRAFERQALAEVADRSDVIVACGGGTPCQEGAMELMNAKGTTVRLIPSDDRLISRLMTGRHKRPLIADIDTPERMRDFVVAATAKREPYYSQARYSFDSSFLENPDEIALTVRHFIATILDAPAPS